MAESLHTTRVRLQPEQYAVLERLGRNPRGANGRAPGGGAPRGALNRAGRLLAVAVFTVLLLGTALVVLSRASTASPGPRWQAELNQYIAYRSGSEGPVALLAASEAQRPSEFRSDLTPATTGNGVFLAVDYYRAGMGAEPVAFPPADAWCALLQTRGGQRQVVFVVQKVSLYYDYWLVNEGPTEPFSPQFLDGLSRIGCALPI